MCTCFLVLCYTILMPMILCVLCCHHISSKQYKDKVRRTLLFSLSLLKKQDILQEGKRWRCYVTWETIFSIVEHIRKCAGLAQTAPVVNYSFLLSHSKVISIKTYSTTSCEDFESCTIYLCNKYEICGCKDNFDGSGGSYNWKQKGLKEHSIFTSISFSKDGIQTIVNIRHTQQVHDPEHKSQY